MTYRSMGWICYSQPLNKSSFDQFATGEFFHIKLPHLLSAVDWCNRKTHIVNLRSSNDYVAKNGKFILQGQEYFKSEIYILEIKK